MVNPRPANSRLNNSPLKLLGSRAPYSRENTGLAAGRSPAARRRRNELDGRAVGRQAEYWYSSTGSQLSPLRTDTDPSGWTWNSLPRLKNGTRLNHNMSSPGINSKNNA